MTSKLSDRDWSPKLLVIDDDANAFELTQYYLTGVVSESYHASSGQEGIKLAHQLLPDVIVLDVEMPGMDGFQVCKHLKNDDNTRDIPILFLSKHNQSGLTAKGLDYGGSDYVAKPFVPAELQARIRSALRSKWATDVLKTQAIHDPLTNLGNRRALDDGLGAAFADFHRNGHPFSLLSLDIDHFKTVNDTYGHGIGDTVIVQVAAVIQRMSRPYDVAARYGGDEFGLILNQTELKDGHSIGLRILEAIRQITIPVNNQQICITASAGLVYTCVDAPGCTDRQILEQVDSALYEAKQQGRDRLVVAPCSQR